MEIYQLIDRRLQGPPPLIQIAPSERVSRGWSTFSSVALVLARTPARRTKAYPAALGDRSPLFRPRLSIIRIASIAGSRYELIHKPVNATVPSDNN